MERLNENNHSDNEPDAEASPVACSKVSISNFQESIQEDKVIGESKEESSTPDLSEVSLSDGHITLESSEPDVRGDLASLSTMDSASPGPIWSAFSKDHDLPPFPPPNPRSRRSDSFSTTSTELSADTIKGPSNRIEVSDVFAKQVSVLLSRLSTNSSEQDETGSILSHEDDMFDESKSGSTSDLDSISANPESKSEASAGASTHRTSELDESSSVQSYNDSVFDDLESDVSSVSSIGNDGQVVFVGAFVDFLLRDPSVDMMIARATSDSGMGTESFHRAFSRILKRYSRDLRDTIAQQQQEDQKHQRVATFISRKTMQASSLLVTRYKERAPKPDSSALEKVGQYLAGLESENSDSSDDEEPDSEPTIAGLETFLLQEKPYKALKWHLRSLVIPNQRVTQVKTSADNLLDFMFCDLGLEESFARAYERVPGFNAWLRLKIEALAVSLEAELKTESPVTEYLRTYSPYLSAKAVQKLRQKPGVSFTQDSQSSSCREQDKKYSTEITPPQEILEDIMAEKLPEVFGGDFLQQTAWAELLATKAFRKFFSEVSDAAYPTFISECRRALKGQIDAEVPQASAQCEERYLLSILIDLQCCSAQHGQNFSLYIDSSDIVPSVDRLKLAIERSTGSEWSWWPLSPPPRTGSKAPVHLEPLDLRQHFATAALFYLVIFLVSSLIVLAISVWLYSPMSVLLGRDFARSWKQSKLAANGHDLRLAIDLSFHRETLYSTDTIFFFCVTCALILFGIAADAMTPRKRPMHSKELPQRRVIQKEHSEYSKVMSWKCTCGSTRRELIASKYASLFRRLAREYPISHYDNNPIHLDRLSVPQTPSNSPLRDSPSSSDTQSVNDSDLTEGRSSRASASTAPSSTDSAAITLDFDTHAFVHLLVRNADRYALSSIDVTGKDARDFFQDLTIHYRQHRGFLRRFLSIFVYSHCDFVKVKRHRAYRFSPVPGFSFPELGKDIEYREYTYSPQPMIQAPVTRHMFNDYFYSCYNSQNLKHSFLHKFISSCDIIETLPQDLLEGMPKRDREVIAGAKFSKVEHFWGIVAREQRSALRVVVYMLLSLMPTIWFTLMWLSSWGHEGDLQNATVPVTISIATLSMVWVVVYSGGGMRDQ